MPNIATYERWVARDRAEGNREMLASNLGALGGCYTAIGEYTKAIACHEESLRIWQSLGSVAHQGSAEFSLGAIYDVAFNDPARAVVYLERAIEKWERTNTTLADLRRPILEEVRARLKARR